MMFRSFMRCIWFLVFLGFAFYSLFLFFSFLVLNDELRLHRLGFIRGKSANFPHQQVHQPVGDFLWIRNRFKTNSTPLANWLLFQEDNTLPTRTSNRSSPFIILVWKYGPVLERRHLRRFSNNKKYSPWENCSVNNCRLTYDSNDLHLADAVIFHLHLMKSVKSIPRRKNRNQRWIFLTDESPINTFLYQGQKISDYNGLFNWSMSYRMSSDVPVPYGRTIFAPLDKMYHKTKPFSRVKRKKLAVILSSNCSGSNNRWRYIQELKRILGEDLKILGRCLNGNRTVCPGHFESDCPALNEFKFYLAFENSNCREYLTEKVFWNSYEKHAVPVIMGAPRFDCERLLPPSSFIHVEDFDSPASLASYLRYLDRNYREYDKLHSWRSMYRVINEHGYFGSPSRHYCRVCQALNYNSLEEKIYHDLQHFLNQKKECSRVDS